MAGSISTRILLSGGKEFANQFKTIASNVKEATSSLKLLDKSMEQNGTTADGLRNRISQLTRVYDLHESAITLIENRMREMAATGKLTEQQQAEFTNEINNHRIAQREVADQIYKTTQELDKYGTEADQAEKETKELGNAQKDTGMDTSTFAGQIAVAIVGLQELVNVAKQVGKKIYEVGKAAVDYNSQMERYTATISAFFRTSGQGAEEAQRNTEALIQNQKDLAIQIGLGVDTLVDANKMLIASGTSGERSQQAVSALAKAIVATGGGNDELTRMVANLQQIQNYGKAAETDMRQFAYAGVDVYSLLADSTGKSVEELKKMDITFDMIVDALTQATTEGGKFFEASQVGAQTLEGKISSLQSTVRDKLGTAFQPVNDALRDEVIPACLELVEQIDWETLSADIAETVEAAVHALGLLKDAASWFIEHQQKWRGAYDTVSEGLSRTERTHNSLARGILADLGLIDEKETVVTRSLANMANNLRVQIENAQARARGLADVAGESYTWGVHMIDGFINGIAAKVPSVGTAAARAANAVRQVMAFTRPDKGPLHEYEQWMPHMMEGFAKGIDDNVWRVQQAAANAAGAMAAATNYSTTNFNGGINLTVNAAPGMNENQIADVVMARMQEATRRKQAVWQ